MARTTLEDQDDVLVRLGMWPFPGKAIDEVLPDERGPIYDARNTLSRMLTPVRLPFIQAKKYRTEEIEALIKKYTQAA